MLVERQSLSHQYRPLRTKQCFQPFCRTVSRRRRWSAVFDGHGKSAVRGVGEGIGEGVGVGVGVGLGVGTGVGTGVEDGVGTGVGVGVGVGSGVGEGVGIVVPPPTAAFKASISAPGSFPSVPLPLYGLVAASR